MAKEMRSAVDAIGFLPELPSGVEIGTEVRVEGRGALVLLVL
jgi:hypothetical protein